MIRFALKSALALGILAAVVPFATGQRTDGTTVDLLGLAVGIQQAATDFGGFCERAPQACAAAKEVAVYTGERVREGVRIGYDYMTQEPGARPAAEAETRLASAPAEPAEHDPLLTGAVEGFPPPRPYQPPKLAPPVPAADEALLGASVIDGIAVPTPAPRS